MLVRSSPYTTGMANNVMILKETQTNEKSPVKLPITCCLTILTKSLATSCVFNDIYANTINTNIIHIVQVKKTKNQTFDLL